jgi:hypothetical protein
MPGPSPNDEGRTVLTVQLRPGDGGTEQEFRQTGVVTDEHFEAMKAGTEMFVTRLGEFLARWSWLPPTPIAGWQTFLGVLQEIAEAA